VCWGRVNSGTRERGSVCFSVVELVGHSTHGLVGWVVPRIKVRILRPFFFGCTVYIWIVLHCLGEAFVTGINTQ